MTKLLDVVDTEHPHEVERALRAALSGVGPAVLPRGESGAAGTVAADDLPGAVPQNIALVIETSGTSGAPKRVALSADALLASAAAVESELGGPGQWLLALPTHYIAGVQVLIRSIVAGTTLVAMPPMQFSAQVFAERLSALTAPLRFSAVVPVQLARLVAAAETDTGIRRSLSRLDALLIGGQAVPAALFARALELGLAVRRSYGATETSGGCVYDGRPIGQAQVRVTDGELEISGPIVAEGYLGDEELTARTFYSDSGYRWYRTGDSGELNGGVVSVTGRLDSVIISGGVKISLERVEEIVQAQTGFHEAIVVSRPSEQWGQTPVVVTGAPVSEGALLRLQKAVTNVLGRPAAPSAIVQVEAIPVLPSGKPDRLTVATSIASL